MAEKPTVMVLKVDLECPSCYKKIKKILCKFPQIRNQVYDEKANKVTITVFCCDPEKFRDKLCCKGCKVIKSIEIKEPEKPKPKEPEKPKAPEKPKEPEKPKAPEKPKEPEKPKAPEKPKEPEKPKAPEKPKEPEKPKPAPEKPKEPEKPKPAPPATPKPPQPEPVQVMPVPICDYPPAMPYPVRTCCEECYHGHGGGPCYYGYGVPPPPPCYDYYGRRGCHVGGCEYYICEENPQSCSIM